MFSSRRLVALTVANVILLASCTSGSPPSPTPQTPSHRGGTLHVAADWQRVAGWVGPNGEWDAQLDPQYEYDSYSPWELFRCCLLRTLLSYNGRGAEQGGSVVRPDLAAAMPHVSTDGLTWIFHLKEGLHYAPPLANVEITSPDIVRAIERTFSPATLAQRKLGYPYLGWNGGGGLAGFFLDLIDGARAYLDRTSDTISGLSTPDRYTLRVQLTRPSGDFAYRMTFPVTAPIPPNPFDPTAPLGVAQGHAAGYAPYLVASGPYMIEGGGSVDFSRPPQQQVGASGYVAAEARFSDGTLTKPGKLILVRNPSWSDDDLRPAYPDRIEVDLTGGRFAGAVPSAVDTGTLDFSMNTDPGDPLVRYGTAPSSGERVITVPQYGFHFMFLDTAVPPFDDLNVRRAVNLVVDRQRLAGLEEGGAGPPPEVATHIVPDGAEGGLLSSFDPYGPGSGDLTAAREAMRRSRYDANGDGRCDAPACVGVAAYAATGFDWDGATVAPIVQEELASIGIQLDVRFGNGCCISGSKAPPGPQHVLRMVPRLSRCSEHHDEALRERGGRELREPRPVAEPAETIRLHRDAYARCRRSHRRVPADDRLRRDEMLGEPGRVPDDGDRADRADRLRDRIPRRLGERGTGKHRSDDGRAGTRPGHPSPDRLTLI